MSSQHVLITGGSRGIGFAVAEAFVAHGARVLIIARKKAELEEAQRKLGGAVSIVVGDVAEEESVQALKRSIDKDLEGRVDVLVNAAGIYGPMGLLEDNDVEKWKATFAVNVFGTMLMSRLVLPYMKKNSFGRIINFSGGGEGAFPRFTAYSSSKGAIVRFTESLAAEVKDAHITVNAIAPGAVNTALVEEVLAAGEAVVGKDFYQKSIEQKESGGASPEKAAALILFLASPAASLFSGKMFAAMHDKLDRLEENANTIATSDIYNVRRIKPKDRGFDW
jgi:NAD(P)-dependent dehydrogenase (short-subunit alcohol dehydrogenase family)